MLIMGKLFYIMGKSASGKDTIYQRLLRNPEFSLERLVIYTTRPIRDGELDGREYHFVTEEDFQKQRERLSKTGDMRRFTGCGGILRRIIWIWKRKTIWESEHWNPMKN